MRKQQIIFDDEDTELLHGDKVEHTYSKLYPYDAEDIPLYMPKPKSNPVTVSDYFYASIDHDLDTCRSVYGIILFRNKTTVKSY